MRCDARNGEGRRPAPAGHLRGVRRRRPDPAGPPEHARPDDDDLGLPAVWALGEVVVTPRDTCAGHGRLIEDRVYQVDVPGGVDSGSTLRLAGRGAVGLAGEPPATCTSTWRWRPHERYSRVGHDLVTTVPASTVRSRARAPTITLPTLDGEEELRFGRLAVRQGLHPAGPGRADGAGPAAGAISRRARRAGADEADGHAGGAAPAPRRRDGRDRRPPGGNGRSPASSPPSPDTGRSTRHMADPPAVGPHTAVAHVYVESVAEPAPTPPIATTSSVCCASDPALRSRSATGPAAGALSAWAPTSNHWSGGRRAGRGPTADRGLRHRQGRSS